jgi:hypothetical protein
MLQPLWRSLDNYFIRCFNNTIAKQSLLVYDNENKTIISETPQSLPVNVKLDIIKHYNEKDEVVSQLISKNHVIPEYNKIMSERAISLSTKDALKNFARHYKEFNPSSLCYLGAQEVYIGKNYLLIYSLLPHKLKQAIDYMTDPKNKIQYKLVTVWYLYHAALKTKYWRELDKETAEKVDSKIKGWYPLPPHLQPKISWKNQLIGIIKRNLGTLSPTSPYMRHTYGGTAKKLKNASLLFGLILGATGAAALLSGAALFTLQKGMDFLAPKLSRFMPQPPPPQPITIQPGEDILLYSSGSTPIFFINRGDMPITGTPSELMQRAQQGRFNPRINIDPSEPVIQIRQLPTR